MLCVCIGVDVNCIKQTSESLEIDVVVEERHIRGHGKGIVHILIRRH